MGFTVGDQYRTNELSLVPGGYTICVRYADGREMEYTKVKKPHAYIRTLSRNPNVMDAWLKE